MDYLPRLLVLYGIVDEPIAKRQSRNDHHKLFIATEKKPLPFAVTCARKCAEDRWNGLPRERPDLSPVDSVDMLNGGSLQVSDIHLCHCASEGTNLATLSPRFQRGGICYGVIRNNCRGTARSTADEWVRILFAATFE